MTDETRPAVVVNELNGTSTKKFTAKHFILQRSWASRLKQQFPTLVYKTTLVYARNLRSTLLRIFSPLFFMFLLYIVNLAIRSDAPDLDAFVNNPDPQVDVVSPIPPCTADSFARLPCVDFIYTPIGNSAIDIIVEGIRANNPGRPIPVNSTLGLPDIEATNSWLLEHPEQALGALHFTEVATPGEPTSFSYVLQSNSTVKFFRNRFSDPNFFSQVPLQVAAEREIARYLWTESGSSPDDFSYTMSTSQFAHPTTSNINIVGQAMGPFVFAANLFNFVMLLASIVSEKERGLRRALRVTGMLDSAYWLSWMVVEVTIALIFSLLLIAFGAMFQFNFFLANNFFLVFFLFFLFQLAMVSFGFFCTVFLSKGQSAVNLGFILFIIGWIFQSTVAFGFPYTPDNIDSAVWVTVIFSLFPWNMLAKGSIDLGEASANANDPGISWANRGTTGTEGGYCQDISSYQEQSAFLVDVGPQAAADNYYNFDCVWPLPRLFVILILQFLVYFILAVYLDNVLADEDGVKRPPWYFFLPSYWGRSSRAKKKKSSGRVYGPKGPRTLRAPKAIPSEAMLSERDSDVVEEEQRMGALLSQRQTSTVPEADAANAIELYGLQKVFGARRCVCCCIPTCAGRCSKSKRNRDFWAIKGSWFAIENGSLFCLLGPNGAGKTTTINCLTGVLPPSGGDALIYGESLSSSGGIDRARSLMGVCPQFDVQWGELTGAEHAYIYGRMKGLPKDDLRRQTEELLEQVRLTPAAGGRTSAYSGGMRRRLSVALALLGDPLVVFLDEPTTGMDPISRRNVWDIIEASKPGRAIVLTTHSMEEADILGDKIGIMARGHLRALGTSVHLKQRFGSGYQLSVGVHEDGKDAVKALFKERLHIMPSEQNGGYLQFQISKELEAQLPSVLKELDVRKSELGITDTQISLTSLEEVFLSIARKAEMEVAAAEGRKPVTVDLGEGRTLEVGIGEEFATSKDGIHYMVDWTQDDTGNLTVLRCTPLDGDHPCAAAAQKKDD